MVKAVLFDIDGTLVDSVDFHARAWQEVLRQHGCDVPFEAVRQQIGKGGDKLLEVFLSPDQIDREGKQIEEERSDLFKRKYLPQVKPFPCLRELFERLKSDGKRMALASSAKGDEMESYQRITGIGPFLDTATSSDDVSHSKPDPDVFRATLQRLGAVQPNEALVIGDSPYDAESAGKAGIPAIGVLCGGFEAEKLLNAGCLALYRDPAELLRKYDDSLLAIKR